MQVIEVVRDAFQGNEPPANKPLNDFLAGFPRRRAILGVCVAHKEDRAILAIDTQQELFSVVEKLAVLTNTANTVHRKLGELVLARRAREAVE